MRARALGDHRLLDRLLRSRAWIWALGILLGGIVAMQVSLLKLNSGISRAVETTATLERENSNLETAIGRLGATERVENGARTLGLVMPAPAAVSYLKARPDDAARAARAMTAPTEAAAALLANDGIVPGSLAAPAAATTGGVATAADTASPTTATTAAAPTTATTPTTAATPTTSATPTTVTTAASPTTATTATAAAPATP
jgi:hypothetical protein